MNAKRMRGHNEDGFTLMELLVSSLLLIIVISAVGGIMYSSQKTEVLVQTTSTATTAGQALFNSIETGVRNSEQSYGTTTTLTLTVPTGSDQMLTGLVLGNGSTATANCEAWYYSASASTVRYKVSSSAIAAPTTAQLATWTTLATGVSPTSGTAIFSLTGTTTLNLAYQMAAGSDPSVPFSTIITSRTGTTGTIACF